MTHSTPPGAPVHVRQRNGALIGLFLTLLFFPVHLLAANDTLVYVTIALQAWLYIMSLVIFLGDRGSGVSAALIGILFGIVGILVGMVVALAIAILAGGRSSYG